VILILAFGGSSISSFVLDDNYPSLFPNPNRPVPDDSYGDSSYAMP
jgi:hypothetical protein